MLLWFAGLLAGGVVVALLLPVRVDVHVELGTDATGPPVRTRVRWLFFSWRSGEGRRRTAPPVRCDHVTMGPPRRGPIGVLAALRTPGFLLRCAQLLREVLHALRPRRAVVRARIGLGDPYETGMLAGVLAAGVRLPRPRALDLEITPDFAEAIAVARAHFVWSLRPALVLWPIVTFLAAPVVWRAARAAWQARRI